MSEKNSLEEIKNMFKDSSIQSHNKTPSQVLKATREKLYTMFCSPMKEEYLHEAFKWVSNLCLSNGVQFWATDKTHWTQEDAKTFSCIARLSITEIHILLPLILRHLTRGDDPEIEEGKILARSADSTDYDRFGVHLVILESIIKCLVESEDLNDEVEKDLAASQILPLTNFLKGNELINLLDRLREIMEQICEYLELVHRYWENLLKSPDEKLSSAEAALRIISVWLSEGPVETFKPQLKRFLIDLLLKNLLLVDRPTNDDLLITALHSVCTQDEDLMETLKRVSNHEEALERYLDHVQREQTKLGRVDEKRNKKLYKLRCGLIKDLL